jgi:hypothetical protein
MENIMPKFTAEVDTESKTCQFFIDGQPLVVDDFSVGKYTYCDCDNNMSERKFVSYSKKMNANEVVSINYNFDDKNTESEQTSYNVAREIGKTVAKFFASFRLAKALSKDGK